MPPRKLIAMLVLQLALTGNTGFAAPPAEVEAVQQLIDGGDLGAARQRVNRYLGTNPGDVDMLFFRGVIAQQAGDYNSAVAVFETLARDHPYLPEPHNNLGVIYARQGRFTRSRDAFEAAVRAKPDYAMAHENLGDIYAALAQKSYKRAVELNRDRPAAAKKLSHLERLVDLEGAVSPAQVARVGQPAKPAAPALQTGPAAKPQATQVEARSERGPLSPGDTAPREPLKVEPGKPVVVNVPAPQTAQPAVAANTVREPAATGADDAGARVEQVIRGWAAAWSARNAAAYLDYYAVDFRPEDGLPREVWVAQRRERISAPQFISIEVDRIKLLPQGPGRWRVLFEQAYRSDSYQDRVVKALELVSDGDSYKIVKEETLSTIGG